MAETIWKCMIHPVANYILFDVAVVPSSYYHIRHKFTDNILIEYRNIIQRYYFRLIYD